MVFKSEFEFENALIKVLSEKGWEKKVLRHCTEKDLIQNWADILYENNRSIDHLNNFPLTEGEMQQLMERIAECKTPNKINELINDKTISIIRDNPDDIEHFGKSIHLKIYDRDEIAAGQSRYQIVQQPKFVAKNPIIYDRRGDFLLLINGIPMIHIELKIHANARQVCEQIKKYHSEGLFSGLFSTIQIFVGMTPNETLYFANPGAAEYFNPKFYFNWADFNNEPITNWKDIASTLLSIPMAHQLIGFYTISDASDGILKVLRSYQYNAANALSDKVAKANWESNNRLGGYIWHTTGSGKTITSFKSAQLISNSNDADKVLFLMDRIELGTQSLREYRAFANKDEEIQSTENASVLVSKLKSDNPANRLIVTSIQKMSRIREDEYGMNAADLILVNKKRIVIIIDEAHRSTFGSMLLDIKDTFPNAIFFGFTGTPIHDENEKKSSTTASIFGDELHRYSLADGIRDANVLGFDPLSTADRIVH